jgi:DNA-directed RNA polymerase subunit N (RpoN/RPB10)
MDTYREYPIRCKTCNDQLACFSEDYETLLENDLSIEEALNQLGIMDYCCRISMMTPTIVPFNMENREVIEGFKTVGAANELEAQTQSLSRPIFTHCLNLGPNLPTVIATKTTNPYLNNITESNTPLQKDIQYQNESTKTPFQSVLLPDLNSEIGPIGIGIPIKEDANINSTEFKEPILVGVPTINLDRRQKLPTVYVGSGRYIEIMNGRTYLAQ